MFRNYAVTFILALGMMCVLLTGGIDISIGSSLAFSGMAAGLIMRDYMIATPLSFLISMAIGAGLGLIIGLVITKGKVPPIVCTLGFMNIYRGLTYLIAKSQWVAAYQFTDSFKNFALTKYLGFGLVNNMIAACVVGGVSLTGGRGSVIGVFLGSLAIAIIGKALPLIGVSQFWQNGIKGLIILVAVILNVLTQRTMDRNNLKRREM